MGLSPLLVDFVFDIIKDINKDGTTILLVEQNAGKSLAISDRAYVLENGKIVLTKAVAEVNGVNYASFADALAAISASTGDVVVNIYDKVTVTGPIAGNYDSITFVGKDTAAEIHLNIQGYLEMPGKKVAFEDLTLSKVAGGYITNAGFMNLAFGVYGASEVTYTSCVFANGAYASYGDNTFVDCTFYRSHDVRRGQSRHNKHYS